MVKGKVIQNKHPTYEFRNHQVGDYNSTNVWVYGRYIELVTVSKPSYNLGDTLCS